MTRVYAGAWQVPAGLAAGSLAATLLLVPPPAWLLCAFAGIGAFLLTMAPLRWVGAALLACSWSLWNFGLRLEDRLPPRLAGQVLTVSGMISSLPQDQDDFVSFRFEPRTREQTKGAIAHLPRRMLVRWYEPWPPLSVGQHWRLELLLKPPWGPVNFQGPDRERWLFAEGIGAVATVRDGALEAPSGPGGSAVTAVREVVFRQIAQRVERPRAAGIIQALAVADRSGMDRADQQLLTLTGTSHLLAISGLHIGLAAGGGMLLARVLGWLLPVPLMGRGLHLLGMSGGVLTAGAYAALAGFGVSTVRSLVMLLVAMAAVSASRSIHPWRAWLLALATVLLVDPFAPLGAGFWFSFTAVAALLLMFVPRCGRRRRWRSLLLAQWAVVVLMLPVSAAWFQAVSAVAFAANLVAIPVVSFLVVPLVLAGVAALGLSGELAGLLWSMSGRVAELLLALLQCMADLQGELTPLAAPTFMEALVALLGGAILLLPRGLPARWCGVFLLAPLFLPSAHRVENGAVEVEILDAGQGTALLVRTAGRTLVYDSGPGDGNGRDMVASVIVPALGSTGGRRPDRVVISHGDLDHAGGLWSLRARYPDVPVHANLRALPEGLEDCRAPLRWQWGATSFEVLHPSAALPYLGNDSSCVVAVAADGGRLLLSGDISSAVESRLLQDGVAPSDVLLVPHHGSKTSSSSPFIQGVGPRLAVATAGLGNRFGFPRADIRQRYEDADIPFWTTGECGALRILMRRDGSLHADSARLRNPAPWRWPAAPGCPGRVELR